MRLKDTKFLLETARMYKRFGRGLPSAGWAIGSIGSSKWVLLKELMLLTQELVSWYRANHLGTTTQQAPEEDFCESFANYAVV